MIWFDIDNFPYVLLYVPVIKELIKRGEKYFITARNFAQTLDLCRLQNFEYYAVGEHGGKGKLG
jgi:hypothetical protein